MQESADVFVDQYRGVPLKDLHMGAMLGDVTAMLREHGLSLADLALMIKAFLTLEGMGGSWIRISTCQQARPYLERAMLERLAPHFLLLPPGPARSPPCSPSSAASARPPPLLHSPPAPLQMHIRSIPQAFGTGGPPHR